MSYQFGDSLFRNHREMLDHIAEAYLSIGPAETAEILARWSDQQLAEDCVREWALNAPPEENSELPSHMERHGYFTADLTAAIARYREDFGASA